MGSIHVEHHQLGEGSGICWAPWRRGQDRHATGKDICNLSFFHSEDEVLLSPNHRFMVTSDNGGTIDSHGYTVIELMEQDERQAWFRS